MNEPQETAVLSFEKALVALEGVVERMSKPDLNLDEMVALYEQGIGYLHTCRKQLEGAEARINMLNVRIKQAGESEDSNG